MDAIEVAARAVIQEAWQSITTGFEWVVGADGTPSANWPVLEEVAATVLSRVDLSAFGLAAGGEGLTSAQIFRLFTAPERDAIFGLIQVEPLILQALMTMALTDARIPLDAPDFLAFVQGLGPPPLGYGVLTPERMQAVLAGEPPA